MVKHPSSVRLPRGVGGAAAPDVRVLFTKSMSRFETGKSKKDLKKNQWNGWVALQISIAVLQGLHTLYDDTTLDKNINSIEKDGTIGLFGEENHILYDLVLRLRLPFRKGGA